MGDADLGVTHPLLDLDRQNAYRRRYAAAHPDWQESGQVYEATVRQYLHADSRVLDIGCGRGGIVELLYPQVALAVGLDPDVSSLAEHRLPALYRAAALCERLPCADASFDLLICAWVLEHLVMPEQALAEVSRVLTPGGHWVFIAPNGYNPLTWANRLFSRLGAWQARLVYHLYGRAAADTFPAVYRVNTQRAIKRAASAVGLRQVALHQVGDPSYLAFNESLFRLVSALEKLTPTRCKIHLVGDYVRVD